MTTSQHTFVLWCPDYEDAEAFNRRLAVRDQHFAEAGEELKAGIIGEFGTRTELSDAV